MGDLNKGISSLERRLAEVSEAEVLHYSHGQGLREAKQTARNISQDTKGITQAGNTVQGGKNPYLLGGSTKLDHNDTSGISSVMGSHQWIQYHQPSNASSIPGCSTCGSETKGCKGACLAKSGQLGLPGGEIAKEARTAFAWHEPAKYLGMLHNEISRREKTAQNEGRVPVMRLNGTSDIGWHRIAAGAVILGSRPGTQFSEYTKFNTGDVVAKEDHNPYDNYNWIHSATEHTTVGRINQITSLETSRGQRNIAVPFKMNKGEAAPDSVTLTDRSGASTTKPVVKHEGTSVGDLHDIRIRDEQIGGVVALRAKHTTQNGKRGIHDTSGFIRDVETAPTPVSLRTSRNSAFRG